MMSSRNAPKINNDNANETWINEKLKRRIHREDNTLNRGDETCLSLQSPPHIPKNLKIVKRIILGLCMSAISRISAILIVVFLIVGVAVGILPVV